MSGIIDWADCVIGDPAVDFAGLFAWKEPIAARTLQIYGDPGGVLWERTRFIAICFAIHTLALSEIFNHRGWVDASFLVLRRALAE